MTAAPDAVAVTMYSTTWCGYCVRLKRLMQHEGIEFAWRIWDAGYKVWYAGDLAVLHPPIDQRRHETYFRFNARHRVWIAEAVAAELLDLPQLDDLVALGRAKQEVAVVAGSASRTDL